MVEQQKKIDPESLEVVLATDCGSTTTKAVLFEKTADGWRQTSRGEAPTTVEKPVADVTIGARNAFLEVQELSGRKILSEVDSGEGSPLCAKSEDGTEGVDLYVSTSSAGGGLQMVVAGVVASMSTASAERAALGAGAIVMDAISIDDGREQYERVSKIRHLRPDIVLIAGGTDGGTSSHPLELAEIILQADPRPRFGETLTLPVIYAANSDVADEAKEILGKHFEFVSVANVRPTLEKESLTEARDTIHELFLHHVMSHAPGYKKLLTWSPMPILPTPAAVGEMVLGAAKRYNLQILAVDIGGATTDVFSVFRGRDESEEPIFNRTVSANLGMSYSVANVLLEAGEDNITRWLPFPLDSAEVRDRLRNKMIRPTSIPFTMDDLILEQAVCREALRLAFEHHRRLAVGLKGAQRSRSIGDLFRAGVARSLIDMMGLDLIIGSGGVLSHAPNRVSSAFMMIDAYQPEGVTRLAVDSIFMMPHLGVFSSVHPGAAAEVFARDCLVPLGTVVAPIGRVPIGEPLVDVLIEGRETIRLREGELRSFPLATGEVAQARIVPLQGSVNVGSGAGRAREVELHGGHAGIILDGRGRPLRFRGESRSDRAAAVAEWYRALDLETS
jgi:uncharacterized protein (TIGR01319 family)